MLAKAAHTLCSDGPSRAQNAVGPPPPESVPSSLTPSQESQSFARSKEVTLEMAVPPARAAAALFQVPNKVHWKRRGPAFRLRKR